MEGNNNRKHSPRIGGSISVEMKIHSSIFVFRQSFEMHCIDRLPWSSTTHAVNSPRLVANRWRQLGGQPMHTNTTIRAISFWSGEKCMEWSEHSWFYMMYLGNGHRLVCMCWISITTTAAMAAERRRWRRQWRRRRRRYRLDGISYTCHCCHTIVVIVCCSCLALFFVPWRRVERTHTADRLSIAIYFVPRISFFPFISLFSVRKRSFSWPWCDSFIGCAAPFRLFIFIFFILLLWILILLLFFFLHSFAGTQTVNSAHRKSRAESNCTRVCFKSSINFFFVLLLSHLACKSWCSRKIHYDSHIWRYRNRIREETDRKGEGERQREYRDI